LISIEDFFYDDPSITPENPWKPLPKHSLEQSPCYPIIGIHNKYRVLFYYCKLHPDVENISLETIEHHCKYFNAEFHKSEILRLLKEISESHKTKNREEIGVNYIMSTAKKRVWKIKDQRRRRKLEMTNTQSTYSITQNF
jgi:hypothetical protein